MNNIKVGDEVLVRGIVSNSHVGDKFCIVEFGSRGYFTAVLISECQKIEHPFVITPQDVGRFAKTRDGKKAVIFDYSDNAPIYKVYYVVIKGSVHFCDINGNAYKKDKDDHDLIGWWERGE
jgi:hypothetical protein